MHKDFKCYPWHLANTQLPWWRQLKFTNLKYVQTTRNRVVPSTNYFKFQLNTTNITNMTDITTLENISTSCQKDARCMQNNARNARNAVFRVFMNIGLKNIISCLSALASWEIYWWVLALQEGPEYLQILPLFLHLLLHLMPVKYGHVEISTAV
ncbi:hypothetical protein L211DRAFT_203424 [Terfezia boudieri ATCC MYA-4762]|uniref:Uncharacterized protein n=1 Tax=Terfezia boudieri ATCC MYA-4762 TaxID=1051890 RepID=A0A3N4LM87_9PEZI|nr:hypothetical protein L211DRAFT_203424 [Terfezia boudieri ATCC MYA-4762]